MSPRSPKSPRRSAPVEPGPPLEAPLAQHRVGETALLADYPSTAAVLTAAAALDALAPGHLVDVVPAERSLLLVAADARDLPALAGLLSTLPAAPAAAAAAAEVRIPLIADGPDLAEAAELLGLGEQALLEAHRATTWVAAFGGFAPGFAYLVPLEPPGLPGGPPWEVPRRAEPRTAVPPGSVGLASRYCGIYPRSSPGGWQLIGRTEATLFDPAADPPALLAPGTRVRFEPARERAAVRREHGTGRRRPAADPAPAGRPVLEVLEPGPATLVQDAGRSGRAAIGVGTSGAFDRSALVAANLAVGNPPHAAALEILLGPLRMRAVARTVVALAGAEAPLSVLRAEEVTAAEGASTDETRHDAPPRSSPRGQSVGPLLALDPGDELRVGPAATGLRPVLAVRGGLVPTEVLGSRSRDTLSALGPAPLAAGNLLRAGSTEHLGAVQDPTDAPAAGSEVTVPLVPGPREGLLGAEALDALLDAAWTVRPDSDRVGVRLDGDPLPVPKDLSGRASEPMTPGAIQVPPSGLPVVFGPDHPTTGGYPVIGVVTRAGLDALAQAVPGTTVRFAAVTQLPPLAADPGSPDPD